MDSKFEVQGYCVRLGQRKFLGCRSLHCCKARIKEASHSSTQSYEDMHILLIVLMVMILLEISLLEKSQHSRATHSWYADCFQTSSWGTYSIERQHLQQPENDRKQQIV